MIILTAGHTGANSGAQCAETHFDEGAENIWLRNRIAEILTNKYNLIVLIDNDHASLQLLTKELSRDTACRVLSVARPNERLKPIPISADTIEITLHSRDAACCVRSTSGSKNNTTSVEIQRALLTKSNSESLNPNQRSLNRRRKNGKKSFQSVLSVGEKNNSEGVKSVDHRPLNRRSLSLGEKLTDNTEEIKTCLLGRDFAQQKQDHYVKEKSSYVFLSKNTTSKANPTVDDIIIDIHFNAHTNPQARGTEAIVSDDATTMELRFASRLAHATADVLNIPLRSIKSESQTPHHRLAMLHLTPQSIILEICFCTSPEDVAQYRKHREQLAKNIAKNIAELITP